jgi:hypothetical protein
VNCERLMTMTPCVLDRVLAGARVPVLEARYALQRRLRGNHHRLAIRQRSWMSGVMGGCSRVPIIHLGQFASCRYSHSRHNCASNSVYGRSSLVLDVEEAYDDRKQKYYRMRMCEYCIILVVQAA